MQPILFELIGAIEEIEVIAKGPSIRERRRLSRQFSMGRWRKLKGVATLRILSTGEVVRAAIHWYEPHGVGRRQLKIKRVLRAGEAP
jgi:hypothetical protein